MPTIPCEPDGKKVAASTSETVLAAALRAGIPTAHPCGGDARCSICRVSVENGLEHCAPMTQRERVLSEQLGFSPEVRLACQTTAAGDIKVRRLVVDEDDLELNQRLDQTAEPFSIGEERELAILFADIRSFTEFSEKLPPYDVIYILNRYFYHMGKIISAHGGSIENYIGDGLMALFGLDDSPTVCFRAVSTGLRMIEDIARNRHHFEDIYGMGFRIGVGIHYGKVVVGTVGQRMTAIGDAVNFASRIESANKEYGTELLISEDVYQQVAGKCAITSSIENAVIKGKSGTHVLYAVHALAEDKCLSEF